MAASIVAMISLATLLIIQHQHYLELQVAYHDIQEARKLAEDRRLRAIKARELAEDRGLRAINALDQIRELVINDHLFRTRPEARATRKALLNIPLKFYRDLRADLEADADASPNGRYRLGEANLNLGLLTAEIESPDSRQYFSEAVAILEQLCREDPGNATYRHDLVAGYQGLGHQQAQVGQGAEAMASLRKALDLQRALVSEDPRNSRYQKDQVAILNSISLLQDNLGQDHDALAILADARTIVQELLRVDPQNDELQVLQAKIDNNISNRGRATGDPSALVTQRETLNAREQLAGKDPDNLERVGDLARSYYNVGNAHRDRGETEDALESYGEALAIRRRLVRENINNFERQKELAQSLMTLGLLQHDLGRGELAQDSFQEAEAIWKLLAENNPTDVFSHSKWAASKLNLGLIAGDRDDPDEALKLFREALEIDQRLEQADPANVDLQDEIATIYRNIGFTQSQLRQPGDAQSSLKTRWRSGGNWPPIIPLASSSGTRWLIS